MPVSVIPADELAMVGQVLLAFLLGGVIGFEREAGNKPAGLRTHMLVAGGTTMFTLASIYGFGGMRGGDPSRVAAQIVSGIGFLGGGTIFRSGSEVRGLTTAATIWLVAAIGMLVGTGLYMLAVASTIISVLVLHFLHRSSRHGGASESMGDEGE